MLPPPQLASPRAECPMATVKLWDGRPAWHATHFADVRSLPADPNISSDVSRKYYPHQSAAAAAMRSDQQGSFIRMDPQSTRSIAAWWHRTSVSSASRNSSPFVRDLIEKLIDELEDGDRPVDFVAQFAQRVPAIVTARLLDMPLEDGDFPQEKVNAVMRDALRPEDVKGAALEMRDYINGIVDSRVERTT